MVYVGLAKAFDSVCVRSFHTQSFLDKIDEYEVYERTVRYIIPIGMTSPGSLPSAPH